MRKRILATIAVFAMVVAMLPTIVMADGNNDENIVQLDVSKGVIDIYPEGYAQTGTKTVFVDDEYGGYEEESDDFLTLGNAKNDYKATGGDMPTAWQPAPWKTTSYIISGKSKDMDSYLDITNFSNETVTYNITFKNLDVRSEEFSTAIRIKGTAPIILNITNIGDNKVYAGNHAAFKVNSYDDHRGCNDEDGCVSEQWWSECVPGEIISDYAYYDKGVENADLDNPIIITVNITNTFGSTLDLGTLWTDEYIDEFYESNYELYRYPGPKIFHAENPFVDMIFMINGKEVVDNEEVDDALSNYDNFDNSDSTCTHKTILDKWSHSPQDVEKMTVEEFENNINGIECKFICDECGDSVVISPEKTRINDEGKGQYGATMKLNEASPVTFSIATSDDNGSIISWSEGYELDGVVVAGTSGTVDKDGNTPFTGDTTHLILWACLLAVSGAAIAIIVGRRRVNR